MKITSIETVLFQPAWDDPFSNRHQRVFGAVTVRTDEGLEGVSRTWGGAARLLHEHLQPLLLGTDPRCPERWWQQLYESTVPFLGQEQAFIGAIGALDVALWDLYGKSVGAPCWQLLGGFRRQVPAYADVPIRNDRPQELGEQLAERVAAGYRAVKFHILQRDPDHIVAEARAARAAIG